MAGADQLLVSVMYLHNLNLYMPSNTSIPFQSVGDQRYSKLVFFLIAFSIY